MNQKQFSFQKTYTLLPQSPLIHFQYGQKGAGLRATEVKPKLDRYIARRCGKELPESWRNPQSPDALNYKMRIVVTEKTDPIPLGKKTDYEIFFANMDDSKEKNLANKKMGIMAKTELTISCFVDGLLKYIDSIIGDFFIVHNFGTMQDKGFGGFVVKDKPRNDNVITQALRNEFQCKAVYRFVVNNSTNNRQKTIFKNIKVLHNTLKTGNAASPKTPSLLFKYFEQQYQLHSEKDWLHHRATEQESAYVRALMGISDHMGPVNTPTSINDIRSKSEDESEKKKVIERVPSPIWFVIVGNRVFFVGREIPENIFGAKFRFSSADMELNSGVLTVPEVDENFLDDYLRFAVKELQEMFAEGSFRFMVEEVQ